MNNQRRSSDFYGPNYTQMRSAVKGAQYTNPTFPWKPLFYLVALGAVGMAVILSLFR